MNDKAREAFEAWLASTPDVEGSYEFDIRHGHEGQEELARYIWTAALKWVASQQAAPEGMRLVPVEPTPEMLKAFQEGMVKEFGMRTTAGYHGRIYRAMLAAAPAQHKELAALRAEREADRAAMREAMEALTRCVKGIDRLAEIARKWKPELSFGADRQRIAQAEYAGNDARTAVENLKARTG